MEVSIREPNIKRFVRLLQCAARFGDDLCMHATKEQWELSVTNSSQSAYCLFTLLPSFFYRYHALGNAEQQRRGVKCKLYAKSVLSVLGKASSVNAVEHIHMKIIDPEGGLRARRPDDSEDEDVEARSAQLEIKMVYTHGVTKKHFLHLQSSDFLRAVVDMEAAPSGFQIQAKTLKEWLEHFNIAFASSVSANGAIKGDSQLAWRFSDDEVRVKNFENPNTAALMTEVKIDVGEFQDYALEGDDTVDLALPMREFKATLQLAEQFNMDLDFYFSKATQPLAMSSKFHGPDRENNDKLLFNILCVIATTTCEAFSGSVKAEGRAAAPTGSRTPSVSVKTESDTTSHKRRSESGPRSGRPRASLSMTAQPPTRGPSMVTVPMGDRTLSQRLASQTLASQPPGDEPLFLPGPSQPMTQAEVLAMAGMDQADLDAAFDDNVFDDVEDEEMRERQADGQADMPPADFSHIDFDNVPLRNMSTQREAIAAAQASQSFVSQRSPSQRRKGGSEDDLESMSPKAASQRAPSLHAASQPPASQRTHKASPAPPTLVSTEVSDDEFEADPTPREEGQFPNFFGE